MKPRIQNKKEYLHIRKQLRNDPTTAERVLWKYLRNVQMGRYKFRRQHGIGNYVVDFYCPKLKLIIELDGWIHGEEEQKKKDVVRQAYLETQGFLVIRYTNAQIRAGHHPRYRHHATGCIETISRPRWYTCTTTYKTTESRLSECSLFYYLQHQVIPLPCRISRSRTKTVCLRSHGKLD
ncbi:MAG: hypothetical protein CO030_00185 [Candidatus Magasanikbacteria bacterium CG_4_9_14_0_2_um_filter_42_11]|uniref:DUF559 domain-containing protein n=1 Tax=Candidatus Magasanikbacteria bacterium CG_4_9_14_0_2_um_filter_42_11 TaxID=1974643 RepID=A0A2M8FB41_9BACT|nr:MAG: hypothetical protein COU34_01575 [Candidatus Magasanikbacteria bacterium CG10_big_fil_rev_8_21_14_0_10_43_9]PIY92092.1 MAG: hypothetical protein COY70_05075 [Candidatus Magasanikbacteria bacterium CG_4_10_14_0_8_um_filter_42_12]PJC52954.1 MAG: hypothetical protein CO030_00185 [Candidatus Magasanikbacteria bacterium CG_4_9_14_0_2_um_filter_42_11]